MHIAAAYRRIATVAIAALAVAACAETTPQSQAPRVSEAQRLRCDYEADAATRAMPDVIGSAIARADLVQACVRAVDAANYEVGAKPSGARPAAGQVVAWPAVSNARQGVCVAGLQGIIGDAQRDAAFGQCMDAAEADARAAGAVPRR